MENRNKIAALLILLLLCSCRHKHKDGITINGNDTSVVLKSGESIRSFDIDEYDSVNNFIAHMSYFKDPYFEPYDSTKKIYLNQVNGGFTKHELNKFSLQLSHYYVVQITSLGYMDIDTFRLYPCWQGSVGARKNE